MTEVRFARRLAEVRERSAVALHLVHGTRGIVAGGIGLLLLGMLEPVVSPRFNSIVIVLPLFALFVAGAATLPREGVAAQQRARALLGNEEALRRLGRTIVWPGVLAVLLAPRAFLAMYGIPHLNPLTGVVFPAYLRAATHAYMFLILLVAALYIRSTRSYAAHVIAKRPVHLSRDDRAHQERDGLLWMGLALVLGFGFVLRGFWSPFSLVAWPPSLESLSIGARGVASISFSLVVPLLVFNASAAHVALVRRLMHSGLPQRVPLIAICLSHIALAWSAVGLHLYDLLWVVQYRAGAPF